MVRILALLVIAFLASTAVADGMFAKLGGSEKPGIPYQRAIVSFRDGIETLVVESTLDGPPGDYVWIVPVPNPPTRVMEVDPLGMAGLARRYRPMISQEAAFVANAGEMSGICFGVLGFAVAFVGIRRDRRRRDLWAIAFAVVLGLAIVVVFSPVFASTRASGAGMESVSAHRAGAYRVDVLRASNAQALTRWVEERGGSLTPEAQSAADAYAQQGWCFVVAQLKPHAGGAATPHPLALEFASKRPVYPMRLTGTHPGKLVLDLYVVANGTASVDPLRVWSTGPALGAQLKGKRVDERLMRNSPLYAMSWPGATITRLRARVSPDQMRSDYEIRIGAAEKRRIVLVSVEDYRRTRLAWGLGVGGLALLISAIALALRGESRSRRCLASMAIALVVGGVATGVSGTRLERIEPQYFLGRSAG